MKAFCKYTAIEKDEIRKQGLRPLAHAYKHGKCCVRCKWSNPDHLWLAASPGDGPLRRVPQADLLDELSRRTLVCALCRRLSGRRRTDASVSPWQPSIKTEPCVDCGIPELPGWIQTDSDGVTRESQRCRECKQDLDHRINLACRFNRLQKQTAAACATCARTVERWTSQGFDWDHLDPSLKSGNVGTMAMAGYALDQIEAEIDKCRLLCVYCHLDWTIEQQGYADPVPRILVALETARIRTFNETPLDLGFSDSD